MGVIGLHRGNTSLERPIKALVISHVNSKKQTVIYHFSVAIGQCGETQLLQEAQRLPHFPAINWWQWKWNEWGSKRVKWNSEVSHVSVFCLGFNKLMSQCQNWIKALSIRIKWKPWLIIFYFKLRTLRTYWSPLLWVSCAPYRFI